MDTLKIILLFFILSAGINADTLENILQENYNNNHFKEYNNYSMQKQKRKMPILFHKKGKRQSKLYFEQFQDNSDAEKHLFVYHSGRYKGLKVLLKLQEKDIDVDIWVPQLRKTIGVSSFEKFKVWNKSNFTYYEILLKNFNDCTHEIIGKASTYTQSKSLDTFHVHNYCSPEEKSIIKIKSTPKESSAPYDYSISYIDERSYHDYKVEYYKDNKLTKTLEKCWYQPKKDITLVGYWYAKNHLNQTESLIYIPKESHIYNTTFSKHFFEIPELHKDKKI